MPTQILDTTLSNGVNLQPSYYNNWCPSAIPFSPTFLFTSAVVLSDIYPKFKLPYPPKNK